MITKMTSKNKVNRTLKKYANVRFAKPGTYLVNINSNGLISLPKAIRDYIGIVKNSSIEITIDERGLIIPNNPETPQETMERLQKEISEDVKVSKTKFLTYQEARELNPRSEISGKLI